MITRERLVELLSYDPFTGVFAWNKKRSGVLRPDMRAGCIHKHGHRVVVVDGKGYPEHRLAYLYMMGEFPPSQIDHINGNEQDNRWINLRPYVNIENARNRAVHRESGIPPGIYWNPRTKGWQCDIIFKGIRKSSAFSVKKHGIIPAMKMAVLTLRRFENELGIHNGFI